MKIRLNFNKIRSNMELISFISMEFINPSQKVITEKNAVNKMLQNEQQVSSIKKWFERIYQEPNHKKNR